ncbi:MULTISPECIES: Na+/H+ antiporter subunit G [Thiorhodovibrio]|uniref:Na+/H+ antiporter subunit G n=1 Tax=Thiorhodovibrio TaxID=61593 RepID=UPI001911FBE9|nr:MULTISPECIES: Na+/H+ antiporter subunit G [Thiorhodovibrio]MBK5969865.1 Na+/H+ antiporter subunit G [Thiorhodovibrio winogradskyi]WPL12091.1 Multiple resistance and pH homeostasis protein G [Thiorhodovibrio litoralis]
MLIEILVSAFVLIGASFALIGSIGLLRLPDFYTRLHGPTKATTLGISGMLIASGLYFSTSTDSISLHEILVLLFLFITAPVSAHLLAKAALHRKVYSVAKTPQQASRHSAAG